MTDNSNHSADRTTPELVLLIDDNRADNLYHSLVFEGAVPSAEVVSVSGGQRALGYLADGGDHQPPQPDLILLDLNMPAMTGWDFIDRYTSATSTGEDDAVLIVLSTTDNPEEIQRAESHPAVDGFISKPLNEARLAELLTDHFNS